MHVSNRAAVSVGRGSVQITLLGAARMAARQTKTGAPNGGSVRLTKLELPHGV
jgi:hypothetical protein